MISKFPFPMDPVISLTKDDEAWKQHIDVLKWKLDVIIDPILDTMLRNLSEQQRFL